MKTFAGGKVVEAGTVWGEIEWEVMMMDRSSPD